MECPENKRADILAKLAIAEPAAGRLKKYDFLNDLSNGKRRQHTGFWIAVQILGLGRPFFEQIRVTTIPREESVRTLRDTNFWIYLLNDFEFKMQFFAAEDS